MANFLQSPHGFTPYIQEQPVEAMLNIGMMKQQDYLQGVKQIQDTITQVAGLPIAKQEVKGYLQDKLNTLRGNVSSSLAGDLSDQSLVNSINSTTRKIATDPIIEKGVQNTMLMQSSDARAKKSQDEGKSSQNNIDFYEDRKMQWLNDGKLDSNFDAKYYDYKDVGKKMFETLKAITGDELITQNPYVVRPDGSVDYDRVAATLTEQGWEGVTANKIENAVRATLTEEENTQLNIDGWARWRNIPRDSLPGVFVNSYTEDVKKTEKEIEQLKKAQVLNSSDSKISNQLSEAISQREAKLGDDGLLKQKLNSQLQTLAQDPSNDGFYTKGKLYKEGYIEQFSKAFSWEKKYLKWLDNPAKKQENWEKDYALDRSANARQWAQLQEQIKQNGISNNLAERKFAFEQKKDGGGGGGNNRWEPFIIQGETVTGIQDGVSSMIDDMSNSYSAYDSILNKVKGLIEASSKKPISKDDLLLQIELYKNGKSSLIPVRYQDDVNAAIAAKKNADDINDVLEYNKKELQKNPKFADLQTQFATELSKKPSFLLKDGSNIKQTFSPHELFEINKKLEVGQGYKSGGKMHYSIKNPTKKQQIFLDYINKTGNISEVGNSVDLKDFLSGNFDPLLNFEQKNLKEFNKALHDKLSPLAGKWNAYISNWDGMNEIQRKNIKHVYDAVADRYSSQSGGAEGLNLDDYREMQLDKKSADIQYRIVRQNNNRALLASLNGKQVILPLTENEGRQVDVYTSSPDYNLPVDDRIIRNGGTTNPSNDPTRAMYGREVFSPNNKFNFTVDFSANSSNYSKKYPIIHLLTPSGWKTVELDKFPIDNVRIGEWIPTLSDREVKDLMIKKFLEDGDATSAEVIQNMK